MSDPKQEMINRLAADNERIMCNWGAEVTVLRAALEKASDFVTKVCNHWEGDPLPEERECKELDALLATLLRRTDT